MEITCPCGCNLADLPGRRKVQPSDGATVTITCPLCSDPVEIKLPDLGVLVRGSGPQTRFLRWKQGKQTATTIITAGGASSKFQLAFDSLGTIEPREVCYPSVPAFQTEDGKTAVPSLPVRAAFFDCVDQRALARLTAAGKHAAVVAGEYHALVPFNGLSEPVAMRLPLHTHRDDQGTEHRVLRGVNLRVWPNTPIAQWKHFLVGLATCGPGAESLFAPLRVRLGCRTESADGWTSVGSIQRKGATIVGALDGRPAWISLEVGDPTAEPTAGGLFAVPAASEVAAGELEVGLDFGTSNTCVAVRLEERAPTILPEVSETRWNMYLVRGGPEATSHEGPDLWPSPVGFGAHADLFASELLFPRSRAEQMRQLADIAGWRYGIDYGIPAARVEPTYVEADYSLAEFKWSQLLGRAAPTFANHIEALQAMYVSAVLTNAYLRAGIASGHWAQDVRVTYSYPASFDKSNLETLGAAADAARIALEVASSVEWTVKRGAHESAAVVGDKDFGADLHVYLDMGGGSTDIAITLKQSPDRPPIPIYLTSVRYAGATLLAGYGGDGKQHSCLVGKATVDHLRRRVREAKTVAQVIGDPALFDQRQQAVTQNRTRHFYGYIVEYVSRMLAAGFLDQRFWIEGADGKLGLPPSMTVAVIFLGNGWRFNATLSKEFGATICSSIDDRMHDLIAAEAEATEYGRSVMDRIDVEVTIKVGRLPEMPHEKAAVALGLLKQRANADQHESHTRAILGWTTVLNNRTEVPWFALYDTASLQPMLPAETLGEGTKKRKLGARNEETGNATPWYAPFATTPSLDWKNTSPRIPASLLSPFDLDVDLDSTRGALRRACSRSGDKWFLRGPYEVMLEELFGPKLRTMGA